MCLRPLVFGMGFRIEQSGAIKNSFDEELAPQTREYAREVAEWPAAAFALAFARAAGAQGFNFTPRTHRGKWTKDLP